MYSQDTISKITIDRALAYTSPELINERIFNLSTNVNWLEDSLGFWYIEYGKNQRKYYLVKIENFKKIPLMNSKALSSALSSYFSEDFKADDLKLSNLQYRQDTLRFKVIGKRFTWADETLSEASKSKHPIKSDMESFSSDSSYLAYRKNFNVFVRNQKTGEELQLTEDGKRNYEYASYYGWYDEMEGEGGDRPEHFSVNWSKNGNYLATELVNTLNAEKMYLLNHSVDTLYRANLTSYYRGSPGDTTMVEVTPYIFNIKTGRKLKIDLPTGVHVNSVSIEFSDTEENVAYAIWKERGYKKQFVKRINLKNEEIKTIWEESSDTSIDNFDFIQLKNPDEALIVSEKSGWKQIYSLNTSTGESESLTNGDFVVNSIKYIDDKTGWVYFMASGVSINMNPYHQQLFRINGNEKKQLLTPEKLHHKIDFSKEGKFFIDEISSVQTPSKTVLRKAMTGEILLELTNANISEILEDGWESPEVFTLIGKDDKTEIYGALWKPTNFRPEKKYPVIDATYTGPHTNVFPKSFDRSISNQSLAELGFIVVAVDGLGTAGRSKAFRDASYMNMGDNLRDHVLAIKHLGKKYDWIDTNKVGIFGHSAGGYDAAHALLEFSDFYTVGVSSAGDHDFRMEKAWWPEMYMGWPVNERYEEVSNISKAKNLKGKLLLVHGGMDHNVNPSATFKLAEKLIEEGKDFDMYILPSQRHSFRGKALEFFQKKRWNYFIEHLLNKKSRWNYNFKM